MMKYQVNDTVLHGLQGVFRIEEIANKEFNGEQSLYYVLKNVFDDKSTVFVPVYSKAATVKMRRVLSVREIYSLIQHMPDEGTVWIENDIVRRERYKEILSGGDRTELVKLIKTLYLHQQKQKEIGKKLHSVDERFMKDAEKILYEEFAHVLNIKREEVLPFITEQLAVEEKR